MTEPMRRRHFTYTLLLAAGAIHPACASLQAPSERGVMPDFVSLIERLAPAVIAVGDGKQTLGSGFGVGVRRVLTAAHVSQAAKTGAVVRTGERSAPARALAADSAADLAILDTGLMVPALPLATSPPRVGEWVVVLGNPFGAGLTATVGIVSGAPGAITTAGLADRVQINASVNPGNSGGPVCNVRGEVVGIATTLVPGGQGIAFATSAASIQAFIAPHLI